MVSASRPLRRARPTIEGLPGGGTTPVRRRLGIVVIVAALLVVWEGLKWLAGDPWRIHGTVLGLRIDYEHVPPFTLRIANDLSLPHVWDIANAYLQHTAQGTSLAADLVGAALFTFQEAFVGFLIGAMLGLVLSVIFVHSRLLERSFVPWVVASQTVPIIALAPLIVVFLGAGWTSVAVVTTYLTFFPVTIAMLRGLRAADPRAFELMRSYAATPREILWKLRLPTAVPYLFPALRISASASVIGAIIGELPSGIPYGLGGSILNYNQYYTSAPYDLWATIFVAAALGLVFVGLVALAERLFMRGRYRPVG